MPNGLEAPNAMMISTAVPLLWLSALDTRRAIVCAKRQTKEIQIRKELPGDW